MHVCLWCNEQLAQWRERAAKVAASVQADGRAVQAERHLWRSCREGKLACANWDCCWDF